MLEDLYTEARKSESNYRHAAVLLYAGKVVSITRNDSFEHAERKLLLQEQWRFV